jgi:uncharacterized membrane protein YhaH (DUF805 family)
VHIAGEHWRYTFQGDDMDGIDFRYLFTRLKGRISRRSYWLAMIYLAAISWLFYALVGFGIYTVSPQWAEEWAGRWSAPLLALIFGFPCFSVYAKRLHDRNRPAYLGFVILVPPLSIFLLRAIGNTAALPDLVALIYFAAYVVTVIIGFLLLIDLSFLRGTLGPNRYGPDPLKPLPD